MAYADYWHCAICDAKAFYDANVDWGSARSADVVTLCGECAKNHRIVIVDLFDDEVPRDVWKYDGREHLQDE